MHSLLLGMAHHGYAILAVLVFIEAIGLPIPAALALLAAGAASAKGPLHPAAVLLCAIAALLAGDNLMFLAGRYSGWWLLGVLCRISLNPESCILRSAETFRRRGRILLLFAKFVPGVNTLAAPLAGSMNMRFYQFLLLDLAGASLYTLVYAGVGFVFSDFIAFLTRGYEAFGRVALWTIVLAFLIYLGYHLRLWLKARVLSPVPAVDAADVARRLYSGADPDIAVFDVRSHGYYDKGASRIKGSVRIEPNSLPDQIQALPKDKEIVLYCTCIRDATSVRVARILRDRGVSSSIIRGGLRSWKQAGLPVETVPQEDVVLLPTFR